MLVRVAAFLAALSFVAPAFAANNVVEITYDAAGNITNLKRQQPASFALTSFSPASGAVGDVVTIYGAGFSTTPASNAVKFNGTVATVSASDAGSISTAVPSGATTGRITVTVGANTVTSAQDFVVTVPGAPVIASFTPTIGASGTSVAVTGSGFDPTPNATTVKLNSTIVTATISSNTAVGFTVPAATASGRIVATTALGSGASAQDFIVPPSGTVAADIITTLRLTPGAAATAFAVGTANKKGLILFDGTVNGYYTMQFSQLAITPSNGTIAYTIVKPDNTTLATGSIGATTRATILIPKLPSSGTYSLLMSPGINTVNANVKVAQDPEAALDGASVSLAADGTLQSLRATFTAAANQQVGIGVLGFAQSPNTLAAFQFFGPDGSALNSFNVFPADSTNTAGNGDGEILTTVAGTYSVVAPLTNPGGFSLQASTPVTGTLAPDVGQDVALTRIGQDARYTFSATAGDSYSIDLSGIAPLPQMQTVAILLYRPDGSFWKQVSSRTDGTATYLELGLMPTTGAYTVTLDPSQGAYGTYHLTLKQGAVVQTTDAPASFTTGAMSETTRFRFSATAGQNVSVALAPLSNVAGSGGGSFVVYSAAGSNLGGATCSPSFASGTCALRLVNLAAGNYVVDVLPAPNSKLSGSIVLSPELSGTLVYGTPVAINASRAGQGARYTFAGTAGDNVMMKLFGVSGSVTGANVDVTVYKPDGSTWTTFTAATGGTAGFAFPGSLPVSGTYTIAAQPHYGFSWQGNLAVDAGAAVTVDGTGVPVATSAPGEPLFFRFTTTVASQKVDLGVATLTSSLPLGNASPFTIYSTTNGGVAFGSWGVANCNNVVATCGTPGIAVGPAGTYVVIATSPATASLSGGSLLVSTSLAGTFVIGNPAQAIAITRAGQSLRYTFSATAGQLLRLNWTNVTLGNNFSANVAILNSSGSNLTTSLIAAGAGGGVDIASIPATGTYTVYVTPAWGATMSASMALVTR